MGNDEADDEASAMRPGLDCWMQQHGAHPGIWRDSVWRQAQMRPARQGQAGQRELHTSAQPSLKRKMG